MLIEELFVSLTGRCGRSDPMCAWRHSRRPEHPAAFFVPMLCSIARRRELAKVGARPTRPRIRLRAPHGHGGNAQAQAQVRYVYTAEAQDHDSRKAAWATSKLLAILKSSYARILNTRRSNIQDATAEPTTKRRGRPRR
jgi:hypothetical protein